MRPDRDARTIAFAKARSVVTERPEMTEPIGPSAETFTFEAGELVNYENTAAMRMER